MNNDSYSNNAPAQSSQRPQRHSSPSTEADLPQVGTITSGKIVFVNSDRCFALVNIGGKDAGLLHESQLIGRDRNERHQKFMDMQQAFQTFKDNQHSQPAPEPVTIEVEVTEAKIDQGKARINLREVRPRNEQHSSPTSRTNPSTRPPVPSRFAEDYQNDQDAASLFESYLEAQDGEPDVAADVLDNGNGRRRHSNDRPSRYGHDNDDHSRNRHNGKKHLGRDQQHKRNRDRGDDDYSGYGQGGFVPNGGRRR